MTDYPRTTASSHCTVTVRSIPSLATKSWKRSWPPTSMRGRARSRVIKAAEAGHGRTAQKSNRPSMGLKIEVAVIERDKHGTTRQGGVLACRREPTSIRLDSQAGVTAWRLRSTAQESGPTGGQCFCNGLGRIVGGDKDASFACHLARRCVRHGSTLPPFLLTACPGRLNIVGQPWRIVCRGYHRRDISDVEDGGVIARATMGRPDSP